MLAAFGGGFTWGGAYVTWAYDGAAASRTERMAAHAPCRGPKR
jgi:3-oxoacyl-[acyl-carrier-protein] synthase-3